MGVKVTDNSMTVIAHDKIGNNEVTCSTPFELGAKNIDWLYEIYNAIWQQMFFAPSSKGVEQVTSLLPILS